MYQVADLKDYPYLQQRFEELTFLQKKNLENIKRLMKQVEEYKASDEKANTEVWDDIHEYLNDNNMLRPEFSKDNDVLEFHEDTNTLMCDPGSAGKGHEVGDFLKGLLSL